MKPGWVVLGGWGALALGVMAGCDSETSTPTCGFQVLSGDAGAFALVELVPAEVSEKGGFVAVTVTAPVDDVLLEAKSSTGTILGVGYRVGDAGELTFNPMPADAGVRLPFDVWASVGWSPAGSASTSVLRCAGAMVRSPPKLEVAAVPVPLNDFNVSVGLDYPLLDGLSRGCARWGSVDLTNRGGQGAQVGPVTIDGAPGPFAIATSSCARRLEPDETCQVTVCFHGGAAGEHAATLRFDSDVGPVTWPLHGTVVAVADGLDPLFGGTGVVRIEAPPDAGALGTQAVRDACASDQGVVACGDHNLLTVGTAGAAAYRPHPFWCNAVACDTAPGFFYAMAGDVLVRFTPTGTDPAFPGQAFRGVEHLLPSPFDTVLVSGPGYVAAAVTNGTPPAPFGTLGLVTLPDKDQFAPVALDQQGRLWTGGRTMYQLSGADGGIEQQFSLPSASAVRALAVSPDAALFGLTVWDITRPDLGPSGPALTAPCAWKGGSRAPNAELGIDAQRRFLLTDASQVCRVRADGGFDRAWDLPARFVRCSPSGDCYAIGHTGAEWFVARLRQ